MRRFLLQGITEKPAIAIVCADFFRCPPQRGKSVQMLDQHHLEQHHRIDAGAPIILTIERLHHFIQTCEVHRCIYLSQQMLLRYQLVYDYELYQISIHFPAFQHLSSPLPILPYLSEKAQYLLDFFDRLKDILRLFFIWLTGYTTRKATTTLPLPVTRTLLGLICHAVALAIFVRLKLAFSPGLE